MACKKNNNQGNQAVPIVHIKNAPYYPSNPSSNTTGTYEYSRDNAIYSVSRSEKLERKDILSFSSNNQYQNVKNYLIGKNIKFFNNEIIGPFLENPNQEVKDNNIELYDNFRLQSGLYWAYDKEKENISYMSTKKYFPYEIASIDLVGEFNNSDDKKDTTKSVANILTNESNKIKDFFGWTKQTIVLKAKIDFYRPVSASKTMSLKALKKYEFFPEKWRAYIVGGEFSERDAITSRFSPITKMGVSYYDYNFLTPVPFLKKELEGFSNGLNKPLVADVESNYEYYVKSFEEIGKTIPEQLHPNFYFCTLGSDTSAGTYGFYDLITLENSMKLQDYSLDSIVQVSTQRDYFKTYVSKLNKISLTNEGQRKYQQAASKYKNIIFPMSDYQKIKEKNFFSKNIFPMRIDVTFSNDMVSPITKILKDTHLTTNFMSYIADTLLLKTDNKDITKQFTQITEAILTQTMESGEQYTQKAKTITQSETRTWNITEWIASINDTEIEEINLAKKREGFLGDTAVFLEDIDGKDMSMVTSKDYSLYKNLMKIVLCGKIKNLVNSNARSFSDVLYGKPAYSDTVMYKISKYNLTTPSIPVQEIFISNTTEDDVINYVDTQVKYGNRYQYTVTAYQVVIGTEYSYSNIKVDSSKAFLDVLHKPSILLVEVPYFTSSDVMVDNPPVHPQVDIIPYKGNDAEILLNFNSSTGQFYDEPVVIDEKDIENFSYFKRYNGKKIKFKTDDYSSIFQVFRTQVAPKSYKDFSGKLISAVKSDINTITPQEAATAAFIDNIVPNTKYYYTFRSIDVHGHFSNPTPVVMFEMVNNNGTVYPVIQDYFMEEQVHKPSRAVKKFIKIKPTFDQAIINEKKTNIIGASSVENLQNVFLGIKDETVFGKQYKLRITSRHTGKKIDINFSVDHIHEKIENK